MTTYYCPRGCQVCDERAAAVCGFACGACGAVMTTDSSRYDSVHDMIEERGIAEFDQELEAFFFACQAVAAFHAKEQATSEGSRLDYDAANQKLIDAVAAFPAREQPR